MDDLKLQLTRCFSAVFPHLSQQEIQRASLTSVGSWDSVATVTLLAVIEEEFGVQFDIQELERLVSFDSILECLQRAKHVS